MNVINECNSIKLYLHILHVYLLIMRTTTKRKNYRSHFQISTEAELSFINFNNMFIADENMLAKQVLYGTGVGV